MASLQVDAASEEEVTKQAEETTQKSPSVEETVLAPAQDTELGMVEPDMEVEEPADHEEKEEKPEDEEEDLGTDPIVDVAAPPTGATETEFDDDEYE